MYTHAMSEHNDLQRLTTPHSFDRQGVTKCLLRNESVKEILNGVRAGNLDFDVTCQFDHCFFMGQHVIAALLMVMRVYRFIAGDMNYRITFDDRTPETLMEKKKKEDALQSNHRRRGSGSEKGPSSSTKSEDTHYTVDGFDPMDLAKEEVSEMTPERSVPPHP